MEKPHIVFQPAIIMYVDGTVDIDWMDCQSALSFGFNGNIAETTDKFETILGFNETTLVSDADKLRRLADYMDGIAETQTRTFTVSVTSRMNDPLWDMFMQAVKEGIEVEACYRLSRDSNGPDEHTITVVDGW